MTPKDQLIEIISNYAIHRGDFPLSSGKRSPYFIDMASAVYRPHALDLITSSMISLGLDRDGKATIDSIGGPRSGADPIVGAMLQRRSRSSHPDIRGFSISKTARKGSPGVHPRDFVEGCLLPGDRVMVVEDVITTGAQTLRACEIVRGCGATVEVVVAVVDRLGGGREWLAQHGFHQYYALVDLNDLGLPVLT